MSVQTDVDICNMALARTGTTKKIQSLNDNTDQGRLCLTFYAQCRDLVMSEVPWGFASKVATLGLLNYTPTRYAYAYSLPTDCLRTREIWTGTTLDRPDNRIEYDFENYNGKRVLETDWTNVVLIYTAQVTDPIQWSPQFCDALAWCLACELAIGLGLRNDIEERARQRYSIALTHAAGLSLGEAETGDSTPLPEEIALRGIT